MPEYQLELKQLVDYPRCRILPKIHPVPDRRPKLPFSWRFRSFLLYRTLFPR